MSNFSLQMTAYCALVAGLALAAWLLGAPVLGVIIAVVILLAAGFIFATNRPPDNNQNGAGSNKNPHDGGA